MQASRDSGGDPMRSLRARCWLSCIAWVIAGTVQSRRILADVGTDAPSVRAAL